MAGTLPRARLGDFPFFDDFPIRYLPKFLIFGSFGFQAAGLPGSGIDNPARPASLRGTGVRVDAMMEDSSHLQ
jgi:hypothetical protein